MLVLLDLELCHIKQKEIFKLMQSLPDKDRLLYWEYDSLQGMADNILKLILDGYDKSTK